VLEQQVSLASARATYQRLRSHTGSVTPDTVARLGVPGLKRLGFTRQKASYCQELAWRVRSGDLDLQGLARTADGAGRQTLLEVRGLGPWSVDIYYLMALRRPDVWPVGDLALADAVRRVKCLRSRPAPLVLSRLAAEWTPWRSVAARILWHFYLSTPGPRQPGVRAAADRTIHSQG
jgi:DNA-3-methyladenine glycosylase II